MLPTMGFSDTSFMAYVAPEKYQRNITLSMAGLKGVAHITDDVVVHGGRNLTRI